MKTLSKGLRNFLVANAFAVFPLCWAVFGWMPDQVKIRMRGWESTPGTIAANGTAMGGEEYGEWAGGRVFRFYLPANVEWKDLVFRFPGASGPAAVEWIDLQKAKLFSLTKAGNGLVPCGDGQDEYVFANPRFDTLGLVEGKIAWALATTEMLLFLLSCWWAHRRREEAWKSLFPVAFAMAMAFTLLTQVALPVQAYWANRASYPFSGWELAGTIAWRFAWMSVFCIVALELLSRCFGRLVFGAAFALAVCVYLESGILSTGLASLNGDVFLLQDRARALWDAAIWASVFVAVLVLHPVLRKHYGIAALCLMVMVGASMLDTKHEVLVDRSRLIVHDFTPVSTIVRNTTYSTNRNVMVFILDSLEREQAHAIMEDPEAGPVLRKQFRGFTEFINNVGAFPGTQLAVPNLLTGRYPDGTDSMADYSWSCYGPESALRDYLEAGYDVFMTTGELDCGYSSRTNGVQTVSERSTSVLDAPGNGGDVWSIRNFTRWRWMPFAAKAIVSDLTGRVAKDATGGMEEWNVFPALSKARMDPSSEGTFLWIHTPGVHVPIRWNRRGELLPAENSTDRACIEQGIFIMGILGRLMDYYRAAGIYDNSLILVLGDHGMHSEGKFIQDKQAGILPTNARPCLWVKPMGSTHGFKSDVAPTTHAQVAAMLKAAVRENLSEEDIRGSLQADKRVYRQMAALGTGWTDWVVERDGTFTIEDHMASFAARNNAAPLQCRHLYSLHGKQMRDSRVDVVFSNVGGGTEYPYLPRETHDASLEFRVPDAGKRYVLQLELYLTQGGSLRARCDGPGAEWEEFPVKPHGTITVHGIQSDPSGGPECSSNGRKSHMWRCRSRDSG